MLTALPKDMKVDKANKPLRIAVVYSRFPFPMMRGDQLTVAHLLSFLKERGHKVDFYGLEVDGCLSSVQSEWLQQACASVRFYPHGRLNKLKGLLTGLLKGLPFQISVFDNSQLKADLREAANADNYDIIYCYYPRTALAIPKLNELRLPLRTFLALQLSQTLNTQRIAKNETNPLKRYIFEIEAKLMSSFEARIWKRFHHVMLIGPADVEAIRLQCVKHGQKPIDNWLYGAHGTDTDKFIPARDDEIVPNRIVFSGSMLYAPNVQAIKWFVKFVWPTIIREEPNATLIIQGRDPVREIVDLNGKIGISVTGTVPDVGDIIRSAQVCINPMLAAGGMQNKLIEYMASGKAVVATSIANEGIMAPGTALHIADSADDFANSVLQLLRDPMSAREMGDNAQRYVRENWTWEKHFLDLESNFYNSIGRA